MNAIDSIIAILTTPVAKRQGVKISAEDCKIWAEELEKEMTYIRSKIK